jgi:DNA-binding MarR family transcriptional regulator
MAKTITSDQLVGAAAELDKPEFTRADLAEKLGVKTTALKDAFKEARQAERLEKVRDDENGKGVFHLTDKAAAG